MNNDHIRKNQEEFRNRIYGTYSNSKEIEKSVPEELQKSEDDDLEKGGAGSGRKKHTVKVTSQNSVGGEKVGDYHYHARSQFEAEGMHIRKYGNKDSSHVTPESHNAEYKKKLANESVARKQSKRL